MLKDILVNVLANLVFWLGLGGAVAAFTAVSQKRFRNFFGLDNDPRLVTCLSNAWKKTSTRSDVGYTISLHEMRAAEFVSQLFTSASFRMPDMVRGLVDAVWSKRYQHLTEVSPPPSVSIESAFDRSANYIIVGASTRNLTRAHFLDQNSLTLRLSNERDDAGVHQQTPDRRFAEVLSGRDRGFEIRADGELAIVERHRSPSGAMRFFCLGRRGDTTFAATQYLVRNWRGLHREFGVEPFALCLEFPAMNYDYSYTEPRRAWSSGAEEA